MKYIHSAANDNLKQLAQLVHNRRQRMHMMQTVLEGVHLVEAFIQAGHTISAIYVPQHKLSHPEIAYLLKQLPETQVYVVADAALSKITSLTQADDIMAVVALPQYQSLPITGDCVVLEQVQDPGNVGTILRSAAAAGITQILLSTDCADVWSPKVLRAGMGAHTQLNIFTQVDLPAWQLQYQHLVYATSLNVGSQNLYTVDLRLPAAWLLGNEGQGLSASIQAAADVCIHIPMASSVESLNVAMAATICLFEQQRQRGWV